MYDTRPLSVGLSVVIAIMAVIGLAIIVTYDPSEIEIVKEDEVLTYEFIQNTDGNEKALLKIEINEMVYQFNSYQIGYQEDPERTTMTLVEHVPHAFKSDQKHRLLIPSNQLKEISKAYLDYNNETIPLIEPASVRKEVTQ